MQPYLKNNVRSSQRGVSLIEVLVAFLLLSIGLLGMSALQINSLKNINSSMQRSQANILAHFMMDAMRANVILAQSGYYNFGSLGSPNIPVCAVPLESSLPANDKRVWMIAMRDILGSLDSTCGFINCVPMPGITKCTVQIYWSDTHGDFVDNKHMLEIRSKL